MAKHKKNLLLILSAIILILGALDFYLTGENDNLAFGPIHKNNIAPLDAKDLKEICAGEDSNKFSCYRNYYRALVTSNLNFAFADLKARYGEDEYVRNMCHPLVHVVGRTAAESSTDTLDAFSKGDPFCWSGYYHGVMEEIVTRIGKDNLKANINKICRGIEGRISFDRYNCIHGLGHGLMALTNNEIFQSLEMCGFLKGSLAKSWCETGVFMENIIGDDENQSHRSKYLKPDQPFYPCTEVEEKYKTECYLGQTSYVLKIVGADFQKLFEMCSGIEEGYQDKCYISIGRDASGNTISDGPKTKQICDLGQTAEQKQKCIEGAIVDFISYYHSDTKALELCDLIDDVETKSHCLKTAKTYWSIF